MPSTPEHPWSAQFLLMLESLRMGSVFSVGRRYARAGNVRSLTISTSVVTALVVDDDGVTYRSRVAVRAFGAADWARVERALAAEAIHAAKLLAGELPADLDRVLATFGLSLFPDGLAELVMDCDCPGWQKPCTHLAAACYVLAESFDADPFGILAWRGRGRDELLESLREHRVSQLMHGGPRPQVQEQPRDFWADGPRVAPQPSPLPGTVVRADGLLEQLDALPLTVGRFDVTDLLRDAYRTLGCQGGEDGGNVGGNRDTLTSRSRSRGAATGRQQARHARP